MSVERSRNIEIIIKTSASLGLLVIASLGAFSPQTRKQIYERDGGRSKKSGKRGLLHAAHVSHARDKNYDEPSNGRLLTIEEHYQDHYNRHGRNGLNKWQNKGALYLLWKKLTDKERGRLNPPETIY